MCTERDNLRKSVELVTKRYRAEIEEISVATLSVDPVEFKTAQERYRTIEKAYKKASAALVQHCEQHKCENR
jgi:hypothetical protein